MLIAASNAPVCEWANPMARPLRVWRGPAAVEVGSSMPWKFVQLSGGSVLL
jgi:hypothetical protein